MDEKLYKFIRNHEKNKFLNYYIQLGSISKAAKKTKISRQTHYLWLDDEKYKEAYEKARKMAGDLLEEEAYRRAVDGTLKPVFYKGKKCGTVREYSDALLTLLLKGAKPDVYKERVENEISGNLTVESAEIMKAARERISNAQPSGTD